MSDLLPLAIHGTPQPGDREALVAAKVSLDLPYLIELVVAQPASPTRVLAIRDPPPFLVDYALVRDPANPAAMRAAMEWALDDSVDDPRATLIIDQLRAVFGAGVTEIPYVEEDPLDQPIDLAALRNPVTRRYNPND